MADQRTMITNLPDSGSAEHVAFELMKYIQYKTNPEITAKDAILDLYTECLDAAKHHRGRG
jgi:hypothetical protein